MKEKSSEDRGIFRRGDVYHIRFADENGRIVRQSTNSTSITVARKVLAKKRTEVAEGRHLDKKKRPKKTLFELFNEYWQTSGSNRKTKGLDRAIKICKDGLGDVALREITPQVIERFLSKHAKERGWSPATRNRYRALLSSVLSKAVSWEYIEHNPVAVVKASKENPGRERHLTQAQFGALLAACSNDLRPIVLLAGHTGMRRGELLNLRWSDVDFQSNTITVRESKSGEPRSIPMNETVSQALLSLPRNNERGLLFPSPRTGGVRPDVKRAFAEALKKAAKALEKPDLTEFRFHDLRHTFASLLVMNAIDLKTVQELLGHHSLRMTMRYSHLAPDHRTRSIRVLDQALSEKTDTKTDTEK